MLAEQIHAYLRLGAGYERFQVGPFLATFTPGNDHPMRNYAIPDDRARPSQEDVRALVSAFRDRGLKPRLEYVIGAAPEVQPALLAADFDVEAHLPVFALTKDQQPDRVQGSEIEVTMAKSDEDYDAAVVVADVAYGGPGNPPPRLVIKARRAMVARGGRVALARLRADRTPVGSGLYPVPQLGVTEIAAVGVLAPYRSRGAARIIIATLAASALDQGIELLWLTAENEPEAAAAREAGFLTTGDEMLHISNAGTKPP